MGGAIFGCLQVSKDSHSGSRLSILHKNGTVMIDSRCMKRGVCDLLQFCIWPTLAYKSAGR